MATNPLNIGDGMHGIVDAPKSGDFSAVVSGLLKTHGVPAKVSAAQFVKIMSKIDALFGAKSSDQKEAVKNVLTFLAIVHGCGPNVKWEEIPCEPEGCKKLMMNEVVDKCITRALHRRFMVNFSARASDMYDASPDLQSHLIPRAVRNGLPITEAKSVIDFLDSSTGVSPSVIANRTTSKYSAVRRANNGGLSSIEKASGAASRTMHDYEDDADSLGGR